MNNLHPVIDLTSSSEEEASSSGGGRTTRLRAARTIGRRRLRQKIADHPPRAPPPPPPPPPPPTAGDSTNNNPSSSPGSSSASSSGYDDDEEDKEECDEDDDDDDDGDDGEECDDDEDEEGDCHDDGLGRELRPPPPARAGRRKAAAADVTPDRVLVVGGGGVGRGRGRGRPPGDAKSNDDDGDGDDDDNDDDDDDEKRAAGSFLRASPRLAKQQQRGGSKRRKEEEDDHEDGNGGGDGESPSSRRPRRGDGDGDGDGDGGGEDSKNGGGHRNNNNGEDSKVYYEVDEILERRIKNRLGSESAGQAVEYLVRWKKPSGAYYDVEEYEDSWMIAENLDQNSLADAFRRFPADADRVRDDGKRRGKGVEEEEDQSGGLDINDFSDDDDDEEEEEDDGGGEEEGGDDVLEKSSDGMCGDDEEECGGGGGRAARDAKDPDVAHLGESDYDSPGTAELVLNRKTYRVGQSYFGINEKTIYAISMILPKKREARCHRYLRMDGCFVCPAGREGSYVLWGDGGGEVTVGLSDLKLPVKRAYDTYHNMKYDEDDNKRSFAYFNETGKILRHPTGRPAVLDLYAGAGGMSLGLEKHFEVKWVVDNDHLAAATLRANKTGSDVCMYTEDVKTFLMHSVRGNPCYPTAGEVDHIHASPPCKGFSRANRNGGKNDMQNNKQTLLFLKAIKHFRPKTATFENVPGLVLEDFKGYLQSVVADLLHLSYQVRVKVLSSSWYGDPQKRRRLILVAARSDCMLPEMPLPTHGDRPGLIPTMTCEDALKMFERHSPSSSKSCGAVLVHDTHVFNHIVPRHKFDQESDFELIGNEPSRTILARARPYLHYSGARFISVREAACLQSFPITYRFYGSLASQYAQVGNAVSVKMATAIARSVAIVHGCAV